MSASQEKKRRRQETEQGSSKPEEKKSSGRGAWVAGGVFAAVIALAAIFFGLVNSGIFQHAATAATVGSHKVSPAMYNFFRGVVSQNSMGVPEEMLQSEINEEMAKTYAAYDGAVRDGIALSEAQKASIDADLENLENFAATNGFSNANAYLTAVYGTGCDVKRYREFAEISQLANQYSMTHQDSLQFSDSEIEAYYEAHRDAIDTVSYREFYCSSEDEANDFAEAARGDEAAFADQARQHAAEGEAENYESDDATLYRDEALSSLSEETYDWLADPSRVHGDTTVVESSGSWAVVQFVDNWTKYETENTIDVRHILIKTDDETSAEQAKAKADEILAGYLAGEQTEEAFGELAKQYSADGNAAQGGIYTGVTPGQMVETFNDWCFDPARRTGDTGVVETQYGAHVMYFVGQGRNALQTKALEGLKNTEMEEWAYGLANSIEVTTNSFGMSFTKKN